MDHVPGPTVLIAPLDWGLGHATRCIPIIKKLLAHNCKVIIAASGKVKALLANEFPGLHFINLPGYDIHYSSTAWGLPFKIVAQIPKLISAINKEQQWLHKVVTELKIDAVISDNRFGLYHPQLVTGFITHQLQIEAGNKAVKYLLRYINYHYINRFDFCWVPDVKDAENLSGHLGHPAKKPRTKLQYIGPQSRFTNKSVSKQNHLLILLSGPEPQRTFLEKKLAGELEFYKSPAVFVRGLPGSTDLLSLPSNVTVYNHLETSALQEKMSNATFIISRCGYSTVMDMAALQKKFILIPTPGQTEQEYLAKHLMKNTYALCIPQKKFRLKQALELAASFPYRFSKFSNDALEPALELLLKAIEEKVANR